MTNVDNEPAVKGSMPARPNPIIRNSLPTFNCRHQEAGQKKRCQFNNPMEGGINASGYL